MLNHSAILIAEDEPFIALDLALAIEDAGGEVIGPAASAKEALDLLKTHPVAAAILDVNLLDGNVSTVVEYLMARGVPLILQSGIGIPPDLAARFPDLTVHIKPTMAARMVAEIEILLSDSRKSESSRGEDAAR